MITAINAPNGISDTNVQPNPNILICFDNGSNGSGGSKFGAITIGGGSGQRLTTTMQISDTLVAGC
jgi:hypothetical protein